MQSRISPQLFRLFDRMCGILNNSMCDPTIVRDVAHRIAQNHHPPSQLRASGSSIKILFNMLHIVEKFTIGCTNAPHHATHTCLTAQQLSSEIIRGDQTGTHIAHDPARACVVAVCAPAPAHRTNEVYAYHFQHELRISVTKYMKIFRFQCDSLIYVCTKHRYTNTHITRLRCCICSAESNAC